MNIYPKNFETKIGFDEIRKILETYSSNPIGLELLHNISFSDNFIVIDSLLKELKEYINVKSSNIELPSLYIDDLRESINRLKTDGTFLEEIELVSLLRILDVYHSFYKIFLIDKTKGDKSNDSFEYEYPYISKHFQGLSTLPKLANNISKILDAEGKIKDSASRELRDIRYKLRSTEKEVSQVLSRVFKHAQKEGWIESDSNPTIRDGRMVLPIVAMHKHSIRGIVHDESTTGKTIFIEPEAVVEINNKLREIEIEERREVVRILIEVSKNIRPNIRHIEKAIHIIGYFDLLNSKYALAKELNASCPNIKNIYSFEWFNAKHPLLLRTLRKQNKEIVPLDIKIDDKEQRILVISGPNAGGKSVAIKTVGLIQYMLQCGLAVPIDDNSIAGIFSDIFIDIGDQQSIEDDLSTYSSHLRNMKYFLQNASNKSLILIDEFGSGTEPNIGSAIAISILDKLNSVKAKGIITTHYQSIKDFAEDSNGIKNSAMLYDRHNMTALFKLSIGRPGSSFAIEIAKKIGLSNEIIDKATDIVGQDYVNQDKYLQDIVRDKRYWENKRTNIKQEERKLEEANLKYENLLANFRIEQKEIIAKAKEEAKKIIDNANKEIELVIKGIREAEAEKTRTKLLRQNLEDYKNNLLSDEEDTDKQRLKSEKIARELEAILRRKDRKKQQKEESNKVSKSNLIHQKDKKEVKVNFVVGDAVMLKGSRNVAYIDSIDGDKYIIVSGNIKMTVTDKMITLASNKELNIKTKEENHSKNTQYIVDQIHEKRLHFSTDIDIRGSRYSEAIDIIAKFIDEALQLSITRLRVLHGTGTGALRTAVRDYLKGVKYVKRYHDEDVRFGGAGITVIELD